MEVHAGEITAVSRAHSRAVAAAVYHLAGDYGIGDSIMARDQPFRWRNAEVCYLPLDGEGWYTDRYSFYCFGPSKPPNKMTVNEMVEWHSHLQTPVLFNHHEPYQVNASSIRVLDLNAVTSTVKAVENKERVLLLTPMRDAAHFIPKYFDLISELTYPHELIDLAFLVGDCKDETLSVLSSELNRVQKMPDIAFRSATIIQKDFGVTTNMDVDDRHKYKEQGPRRKAMAKARNFLLSAALGPDHSWVYWRDVDITDSPSKIIEDFVAHNKDILVPSALAI